MNLPDRIRRRSQRDAEAVRREFWARVASRNGTIPPRIPVEEDDHGMPAVIAVVCLVGLAGLVVALVALAYHIGWIAAGAAVVVGPFLVGGRS